MYDRGNRYRSGGPRVRETRLVLTLGLLMAGWSQVAPASELGEDCRAQAASSQTLRCAPVDAGSQSTGGSGALREDWRRPGQPSAPAATADSAVPTDAAGPEEAAADEAAVSGSTAPETTVTGKPASGKPASGKPASGGGAAGVAAAGEGSNPGGDTAGQGDETLAADGVAAPPDIYTVAPAQGTEVFNIDIETAESVAGLVPPASERDLFSLEVASNENSDDYDARTYSLSYRNQRRPWFWPWQEATTRGLDWGLDVDHTKGDVGPTTFESLHVQGTLGTYLTAGTYLQARLGRHVLETDQGDRTLTSHRATAMFGLNRSLGLQLETARDFIYAGGSVTGGINQQLAAVDHAASVRWRPHQRLRIQVQGRYREHESDNTENVENVGRQAAISAMYGISPGWPWVWAGVGAEQLRYDRQEPAYWSPERYTAYGLRFESSFPVFARLSGSAAANLNRQSENGADGTGYYLKAGLQYRLYGQLYARLDVSRSKNLQQSSDWSSEAVVFSLSGPLF